MSAWPDELRPVFIELLRPAQKSLGAAELHRAWRDGLRLAVWSAAAAAAMELAALVSCRLLGLPFSTTVHICSAAILAVGFVVVLVRLMVALRATSPEYLETAQRMDDAHDDHNRIATAWSLLERTGESGFVLAAVHQGLQKLRQVTGKPPALPAWPGNRNRTGPLLVGIATIMAFVLTLGGAFHASSAPRRVPTQAGAAANERALAAQTDQAEHQERDQRQTPTVTDAARSMEAQTTTLPSATTDYARTETVEPQPFGSSHGASVIAGVGAAGGNGPSRYLSRSETSDRRTALPSGTTSESRKHSSVADEEGNPSGAISGGGAGAGESLAIRNTWSQREAAVTDEVEATEEPAEPQEESQGNQQRGGVQPSLPDRTQAPSRELGITGPQTGRPGTGRGGPSPAKKARGAAALLMGVPMPDFVRGRIGPGPVAVTVEETAPSVSPQLTDTGGPAAHRSVPESVIHRFEFPWSEAAVARQYLVEWHDLDRLDQRPPPAAQATTSEAP